MGSLNPELNPPPRPVKIEDMGSVNPEPNGSPTPQSLQEKNSTNCKAIIPPTPENKSEKNEDTKPSFIPPVSVYGLHGYNHVVMQEGERAYRPCHKRPRLSIYDGNIRRQHPYL